jgi:hypothetical protein
MSDVVTTDKASFYIDGYLLPQEQIQDFTLHVFPDMKTHGTILLTFFENDTLYDLAEPFVLLVQYKKQDNTDKVLFNGLVKKIETNLYINADDGCLSLKVDFEET